MQTDHLSKIGEAIDRMLAAYDKAETGQLSFALLWDRIEVECQALAQLSADFMADQDEDELSLDEEDEVNFDEDTHQRDVDDLFGPEDEQEAAL